jgi:hypothetical protein
MAGIDSLVNSRADMFAANPQGLQQRYAMNQDLLDLLALQKLKKDKEAAQRSLQMQMQPESGTVKDQLSGQVMDMTKQEVAASLAPGLQQQGQMMQAQQMQKAMASGLPTQPAPNMVGMARGGIVGYAPGGDVELTGDPIADAMLVSKYGDPEPSGLQRMLNEYITSVRENARRAEAGVQEGRRQVKDMGLTPEEAPRPNDSAQYVELMQNPPGRTPESDAAGYVGLMQRGKPSTTEAPAGLPSLAPSRTAPMRQGTEKDIASMLGEDVAPMQRAAPTASTDPRMSRYEAQLDRLEAEEKDKLGSLIDFLLAAGASGGTNLGATLMGGGSGLQAREQRIQDEMARTIQNIETLQLERERMTQSAEQAAAERASREGMSAADIASREGMNAADIGSRETIAELDRAAAAAIRGATNSSVLTQEQQANLRTVYNSYSGQYELLLEAANDATAGDAQRVAASALAEQVAKTMKDLEAQLYKPTMGGGADLSSGLGGDDEINALVEQYK